MGVFIAFLLATLAKCSVHRKLSLIQLLENMSGKPLTGSLEPNYPL